MTSILDYSPFLDTYKRFCSAAHLASGFWSQYKFIKLFMNQNDAQVAIDNVFLDKICLFVPGVGVPIQLLEIARCLGDCVIGSIKLNESYYKCKKAIKGGSFFVLEDPWPKKISNHWISPSTMHLWNTNFKKAYWHICEIACQICKLVRRAFKFIFNTLELIQAFSWNQEACEEARKKIASNSSDIAKQLSKIINRLKYNKAIKEQLLKASGVTTTSNKIFKAIRYILDAKSGIKNYIPEFALNVLYGKTLETIRKRKYAPNAVINIDCLSLQKDLNFSNFVKYFDVSELRYLKKINKSWRCQIKSNLVLEKKFQESKRWIRILDAYQKEETKIKEPEDVKGALLNLSRVDLTLAKKLLSDWPFLINYLEPFEKIKFNIFLAIAQQDRKWATENINSHKDIYLKNLTTREFKKYLILLGDLFRNNIENLKEREELTRIYQEARKILLEITKNDPHKQLLVRLEFENNIPAAKEAAGQLEGNIDSILFDIVKKEARLSTEDAKNTIREIRTPHLLDKGFLTIAKIEGQSSTEAAKKTLEKISNEKLKKEGRLEIEKIQANDSFLKKSELSYLRLVKEETQKIVKDAKGKAARQCYDKKYKVKVINNKIVFKEKKGSKDIESLTLFKNSVFLKEITLSLEDLFDVPRMKNILYEEQEYLREKAYVDLIGDLRHELTPIMEESNGKLDDELLELLSELETKIYSAGEAIDNLERELSQIKAGVRSPYLAL